MRVFHRLKRALSSSIGGLLDDIENHEAVVAATIHEVERNALRVKGHRDGCERRIETLQRRTLELDEEFRRWRERARRLRHEREKALECVRRLRSAAVARKDALDELARQRELLGVLCADERMIDSKLDELRRQSARLSSRQAATDADGARPDRVDVDDVIRRWEARITQSETLGGPGTRETDPSSPELTPMEEAALVSAELDRLLAEEDDP